MSELAKFVAATLHERVAVDLEEENKALRKENERLEVERTKTLEYASQNGKVEITGKDCVPVYAHGEMKDSGFVFDNGNPSQRYLDLASCENPLKCPTTKVKEAEIRLNGLLVVTLSEYDKLHTTINVSGDPHGPGSFTSWWYSFNPKTHDVGGLWNNKTLKLYVVSDDTPEKVRFLSVDLVEEVHE